MTKPNYAKDFLKLIESFAYRFDRRELFRDWTELMAAMLHQKPYHDFGWQTDPVFERVEADYLATAKRYEGSDFDVFAEMISITNEALREQKQDFLGQCFMQLGVASKGWGQEFTPYEMSYVVARMTMAEDVAATIDRIGFVTIHEPACGAGGMIIAAAQMLEEAYRDATSTLWFDAIDIDRMCANMTYIQCALLGLSGIVFHGDTLRMDMRSWRITPAAAVNYERTRRMFDYTRGQWEPPPPLPATGLVQVQLLTV
jgi:type I restriction-modification system DNA methylase subunit